MKKLILRLITVTALISSFYTTALAQGHGVSGPVTGGSKTNADEMILTRTSFQDILNNCMSVELLEITRTLAKDSSINLATPTTYTDGRKTTETIKGLPGHSTYLKIDNSFINFPWTPDVSAIQTYGSMSAVIYDDSYFGSFKLNFRINRSGNPGSSFDVNLKTKSAPMLHYTEASLPDSFDEYGNVIQDKIIIEKAEWITKTTLGGSQPIDLNSTLQLFNDQTGAPLTGLTFNQPRYVQCVNLNLGKYVPSNP